MTNPYYTATEAITPFSRARAEVVSGEFDRIEAAFDDIDVYVKQSYGPLNYRATIEEAIAEFEIDTYFTSIDRNGISDHPDTLRTYQRIEAAPGYEDQGDEAAPVTRGLLGGTGGAALVGIAQGGTVQDTASSLGQYVTITVDSVAYKAAVIDGGIDAAVFGINPGGTTSIAARFFAVLAAVNAAGYKLRLGPGTYPVYQSGQYLIPAGFCGIQGAGRTLTIIDGGAVANLGRLRPQGTSSLHWEGFTFRNFYNPGYTGDKAVTLDPVTIKDFGVETVGSGPTLGCTVKNVDVEGYYCDGVANPHDANIGCYGLMIGCDFGADVANSFNQAKFSLRRVFIKNVNGAGRAAQVPTNGIALRAWNATVDTFVIDGVVGPAGGVDCEGFYGKLAYSQVCNGYIKNAGGDEGMFVLKGDEPPYLNPTAVGNFLSTRTTVRNVTVECTDGNSLRGFNFLTNNVDIDFVTVIGTTGTGIAFSGQNPDNQTTLRNFRIKDCSLLNSINVNGVGTFIIENGEILNPTTGVTASHDIYGLSVAATVTANVRIVMSKVDMVIPASYTGTGRAALVRFLHPTGINVNATVRDCFYSFNHGVADNLKFGIVNESTVTGTTDLQVSGLRTTNSDFHVIRALGTAYFTSITASDWGPRAVVNFTGAQTLNESHVGRIISTNGAASGFTVTLCKAQLGAQIRFHPVSNSMTPAALGGSGDTIANSAAVSPGAARTLICVAAGVWTQG